jgi:hypothetical protein
VTGTLHGRPFVLRSAGAAVANPTWTETQHSYPAIAVHLLDVDHADCDELGARKQHPGTSLRLFVFNATDASPIKPGTYPVIQVGQKLPAYAAVYTHTFNATCTDESSGLMGAGTVTITEVTTEIVRGAFDVQGQEGSADHLAGRFTATVCQVPPSSDGSSSCATN